MPQVAEEGQISIIDKSEAEVGKPLWIKFEFSSQMLNNRMTKGKVLLTPRHGFGGYERTFAYVTEGEDGDAGPTRSIVSGRCQGT